MRQRSVGAVADGDGYEPTFVASTRSLGDRSSRRRQPGKVPGLGPPTVTTSSIEAGLILREQHPQSKVAVRDLSESNTENVVGDRQRSAQSTASRSSVWG